MKRWQDRGEVEDSEDEELTLSLDSPSPERPHKRAKHDLDVVDGRSGDTDVLVTDDAGDGVDDEDEIAWLPTKVANTYGRKGKLTRPTRRVIHKGRDSDSSLSPLEDSPAIVAAISRSPTGAEPVLSPEPAYDNTSLPHDGEGKSSAATKLLHDLSKEREWPELRQPTPCPLQTSDLHVHGHPSQDEPALTPLIFGAHISSSPDSDGENLPDARDLFAARRHKTPSLAPSSPLSELEVSPPAYFETRSDGPNAVGRNTTDLGDVEHEDELHDEIWRNSMLDNETLRPSTARRSLRARKEIQLHPYLIDKAKYQRQCKERGIKPVRLVDIEPQQEGSQGHQDSSQQSVAEPPSSSPAAPDDILRGRPLAYVRLAEVRQNSSDNDFGIERAAKRRRISEGKGRGARQDVATATDMDLGMHRDALSMPPSPPRTLSETSTPGIFKRPMIQTASGFRRLRGLTPATLPTPHVSSDVRIDDDSSTGSVPRIRRQPRRTLSQSSASNTEQSAVSEPEPESESELVARRLQREQKRIRGVLPASWLRIDFRAQKQPKSHTSLARRRLSTASPGRITPQRGVAKRIGTTGGTGTGMHNMALTSDDGADSDVSVQFLREGPKQSHPVLDADRLTVAPSEAVDDGIMENDFVDAMLAGESRRPKRTKPGSRQTRITNVFQRSNNENAFSEERRARQQSGKAQRVGQGRHTKSLQKPRRPTVKLSIADAPSPPSTSRAILPPFIRLAIRQARKLPDQGRHSPTNKVIRLATADDTRDAVSVLRSWREGTIVPRRVSSTQQYLGDLEYAHTTTVPNSDISMAQQRQPPADISNTIEQEHTAVTLDRNDSNYVREPQLRRAQLGSLTSRVRRPAQSGQMSGSRSRFNRVASPPAGLRAAQLETLQRDFDETHRAAVFERRIQCLTESVAVRGRRTRTTDIQLAKYIRQDLPTATRSMVDGFQEISPLDEPESALHGQQRRALAHRPRKRRARRLDLGEPQYWQANATVLDSVEDVLEVQHVTDVSKPVLQDLGAFGTLYPIDFETKPLPPGRCFQHDGLIGSGDLHNAKTLASNNLDGPRGHMSVHLEGDVMTWSAWNEDIAAGFSRIPSAIGKALQLQKTGADDGATFVETKRQIITYLLRSVVRYCSNCLHFMDPVDRQTCVESLQRLVVDLAEVLTENQTAAAVEKGVVTLILQYEVVIAYQAIQLSTHPNASRSTQRQLQDLLDKTARDLGTHALTGSFEALRTWCAGIRLGSGIGLEDQCHAAHTLVILNNTTQVQGIRSILWEAIEGSLAVDISTICSVKDFDTVWQNLFSVLPLLQVDATGSVMDSYPSTVAERDWTIVRRLITRVFELYENSSLVRGFTVNAYVRSLLHRCHRLISKWQWWKCEPVLYTVYDFFSKQSRMLLRNEESRGSPRFLEHLSARPSLDISPDDLSFHIFLKILATGLVGMREHHVYNDRKIGASITYRMIPTHGRTYPKEKDMQQDDVDALRNHHDLLCTLYYASPPGYRPGVDILRNLVDHANWHRKACQLNVKAWAMLTAFQASTYEPTTELQPLAGWFSEILRVTIMQYRLARSEAEHDFHHARGMGADIAEAFLHGTIATNQLHIALTLVDALTGLKRAFEASSTIASVQVLVRTTSFWTVFELFDASQRRLLSAVNEALYVIEAALASEDRLSKREESQMSSSDSQEFGDFSALDELVANDDAGASTKLTTASDLLSPMSSFLSNVFGADTMPDDTLLESSVRVWIRMGKDLVSSGQKTWASYVDEYSPNSWLQMRDTKQKRKFTPYYMSRIVEQPNVDDAVRQSILTSWLLSLVEREALLKFQHVLTSALLTHCELEPLLRNLPFARDTRSGHFMVSLDEFRQRRLAVISSVLSNMRQALSGARQRCTANVSELRSRYTEMLRQLMQTMKHNYQELRADHGADVADERVQGAYVELVQAVVSLLQQHTADFCQIDKFFTDSSAFPLPAGDPTYVVGKMKGYALKLADSGPRRELTMFVQSVSERAAVDAQQQYLVNQIAMAMCGEPEVGDNTAPTLRHVLLTTILPAYIDKAFSSACGWILSLPLLQACEIVLHDMLHNFDIHNEASTTATVVYMTAVLHSINGQCNKALTKDDIASEPSALRLLAAMHSVCMASLTTISCIDRQSSIHSSELLKCIRALYNQSHDLQEQLEDEMPLDSLDSTLVSMTPTCHWPDTKAFAERQVRDSMNYWYVSDGKYHMRRGNTSRRVEVHLGSAEEERTALLQVIARFHESYEATFDGRRMRRQQVASEDACGVASLMI